jgi:DNA-binding beta-propeller fold protein YncE
VGLFSISTRALLAAAAALDLAACRPHWAPQGWPAAPAVTTRAPESDYLVFVASEASDELSKIRFGPHGIGVDAVLSFGTNPVHRYGAHGVALSPDGEFVYVTTAHGTPYGSLWKFSAAGDSLIARVTLGMFPATVDVTPDGAFAYAVNFNLYGPHEPSSVSIVSTSDMAEVARVRTCVMPHGSRLTRLGAKHYSACMMDDELVEIDARTFGNVRRLAMPPALDSAHARCSPTWALPSTDGARVFVACNGSNEIIEVDAAAWKVTRRFAAGNGVYNLAVTPDGRQLVASNKRDQSASIFDIPSGRELARIRTSRRTVHGVAISPDGRYAFVTAEGIGAEPGSLDVMDLRSLSKVATVDVGSMAGGVAFWKGERR